MEQTKKSTFKLLFYLKKNELKKNGNAPIMARITIDGDIALGKHIRAKGFRNGKANLVIGLGLHHFLQRGSEVHMARQRVAANLCAVLGCAFDVDSVAQLVAAQRGDVQALQHHIKAGAGGGQVFRHSQANAVM